MTKRLFWTITLSAALMIMLVAFGSAAAAEPDNTSALAVAQEQAAMPVQQDETAKYGLVSGPVDDAGFNQLAWEGLQKAAAELGVEANHIEAVSEEEIAAGINEFITQGYNGIVSVGFGQARAVKAASQANPEVMFINVDFPSQTPEDLGLLFSVDEPAFGAGYIAAGSSQSGVVCTYGGTQIPPVLMFMVGFEHGVKYYNEQNNTNVQVLGWETDPAAKYGGSGTFAGNFQNQDDGRALAEQYNDQGCDVIFPVAGAVGLGSAAVAQERGFKVIGVDADQSQTVPQYADVYLTSVLKQIDTVVYEAVKLVHNQELPEEQGFRNNYIGTLENEGVGLAPFSSDVPQQVQDDIAVIGQEIAAGNLSSGWPIGSAQKPGLSTAALLNATYQSEWTESGLAPLTNGEYREPAAPGSATETVVSITDKYAFGDVTGTGVPGAAIVLATDPGGSGVFYDLAIVVDIDGKPVNVASVNLGDRVQVNSVSVENGDIVVNMLTHGPGQAMAEAPTQEVTKRYNIQISLVEAE